MRVALITLVLMVIMLFGVACGLEQNRPKAPSLEEILENSKVISMTLEDGRSMPCLFYSKADDETFGATSWLILDCNWAELR